MGDERELQQIPQQGKNRERRQPIAPGKIESKSPRFVAIAGCHQVAQESFVDHFR